MVAKETPLQKSLQPTGGWNPMYRSGPVVRFRCMNCGTLLGIASRDMQGEFECKCPVCKHVHVFNRHPQRWGGPHNLESMERMLIEIQGGR